MDVAIFGTGEAARRFGRVFLVGHTPETDSPDDDREPAITLYGSDATAVMDAVDALEDEHQERAGTAADRLDRIDGTTDRETAVGEADLVIETRSTDLETVRRRLAGIEDCLDDKSVLAVQADVADPTVAAAALERPERAVGLSMVAPDSPEQTTGQTGSVIEVVRADQTDDVTVDVVTDCFERVGWTPVIVNDAPGRVSSRLQLALEVEAMRAVEADVAAPVAIDAVVERGFDHAQGPLASADRAGLDNRLAQLETLAAELGPRFEPPAVLESKVDAGQLGKKAESGFREWEGEQPIDGEDSTGA